MQIIEDEKNKIYIEKYSSEMEFHDELKKDGIFQERIQSDLRRANCGSFKNNEKFYINGWKEDIKNINQKLRLSLKMLTDGNKRQSQERNSMIGYRPNVSAYLMNLPKDMFYRENIIKKQPIVSIFFDITCAWYITKEDRERTLTKLLEKIYALETSGYRVRITALITSCNASSCQKYEALVASILLKREDQRINLSRIMYPLINTGFFRGYGFYWISRTFLQTGVNFAGLGCALHYYDDLKLKVLRAVKLKNEKIFYVNVGTNVDELFKEL